MKGFKDFIMRGNLIELAVAFIVVLCMSGNYVVVRHRRDIGMTPSIWLAGLISGLVALPMQDPLPMTQIHAFVRTDVSLSLPAQRLLDAVQAQAQRMQRE